MTQEEGEVSFVDGADICRLTAVLSVPPDALLSAGEKSHLAN